MFTSMAARPALPVPGKRLDGAADHAGGRDVRCSLDSIELENICYEDFRWITWAVAFASVVDFFREDVSASRGPPCQCCARGCDPSLSS